MKKVKLTLKELAVKSFNTNVEKDIRQDIKGGYRLKTKMDITFHLNHTVIIKFQ